MTPLEREIENLRKLLLQVERSGLASITRSYKAVLADLNAHLDALTKQITAARSAGQEVNASWLARQERYQALIAQQEQLTLKFLQESLASIEETKGAAIERAHADAPKLTTGVMGPAPAGARAAVESSFTKLPTRQIEQLVRNAADGRPLASLLAEVAPTSTQALQDALLSGVARGAGVREIARDVRAASGIPLSRALTISRTEVMRAYRETSLAMYKTFDAVRGWIWAAEANACPVCSAEAGSEHSTDEVLVSHPCCRCTMIPKTLSWAELGFDGIPDGRPVFDSAEERFVGLSADDQLAALGRARLDAYNAGKITLQEMVRETRHPRWGAGKRTATLKELGLVGSSA